MPASYGLTIKFKQKNFYCTHEKWANRTTATRCAAADTAIFAQAHAQVHSIGLLAAADSYVISKCVLVNILAT